MIDNEQHQNPTVIDKGDLESQVDESIYERIGEKVRSREFTLLFGSFFIMKGFDIK